MSLPKKKQKRTKKRSTSKRKSKKKTVSLQAEGYRLRTGKVIPISKDYREKWILLKAQPKMIVGKRKDYLYHGTIDTHLHSIKKYGLMISDTAGSGATRSSAWGGDERHLLGFVSVTDRIRNAVTYGLHAGLLSGREGNQVVFVVDRTKLTPQNLFLEKSGAPPAKEWTHAGEIPPSALVGYWHNIGKVKRSPTGVTYIEEAPSDAKHKGWAYFSNPAYRGELE